jgi:hypothetical protein
MEILSNLKPINDEEEDEGTEYYVYFSTTATATAYVTADNESDARDIAWDLENDGRLDWEINYDNTEVDDVEEA